jgi:hypothetical protein
MIVVIGDCLLAVVTADGEGGTGGGTERWANDAGQWLGSRNSGRGRDHIATSIQSLACASPALHHSAQLAVLIGPRPALGLMSGLGLFH